MVVTTRVPLPGTHSSQTLYFGATTASVGPKLLGSWPAQRMTGS